MNVKCPLCGGEHEIQEWSGGIKVIACPTVRRNENTFINILNTPKPTMNLDEWEREAEAHVIVVFGDGENHKLLMDETMKGKRRILALIERVRELEQTNKILSSTLKFYAGPNAIPHEDPKDKRIAKLEAALKDIIAATSPYGIPKDARWICDRACEVMQRREAPRTEEDPFMGSEC